MPEKYIIAGDLDTAYVCGVWSNIERLAETDEDVVLDLSGVNFIDSHGAGAIVSLLKRLKNKGLDLKVAGLHGQPLRLFLNLHLVPILSVPDHRS